jgi:hypothetical protein
MTPSDMGPLAESTRYFWASPKAAIEAQLQRGKNL